MSRDNWSGKESRAEVASSHVKEMDRLYRDETFHSIATSKVYFKDADTDGNIARVTMKVTLDKLDSVKAVFKYAEEGKVCILNFASYKNPGGGFVSGAMAQEEALCHSSNLYNILNSNYLEDSFYIGNRKNLNFGMYNSNLIFTPSVLFIKDDYEVRCNVITCAAPNRGVVERYRPELLCEVDKAMKDRVDHILYSAYDNEVDTLILGAFGCGVFKNDATVVARIFKEFLDGKYKDAFSRVIFAIPDDKNYNKFKEVFSDD